MILNRFGPVALGLLVVLACNQEPVHAAHCSDSGVSISFSTSHHGHWHHGHHHHGYHHYRTWPRYRGCSTGVIVTRPTTVITTRATTRVWVPGHYRTEQQRVLVGSSTGVSRTWVPPTVTNVYDARGNLLRVERQGGYWREGPAGQTVETRQVRTWVPGHWVTRY